ncbi:transmembrane channel-like protein 7 [Onthophagus taurus]|uniref:transmembrane channel-like protein 7 n=1 Tax=Onthophagus taurus TaxID=166361 RepID=UPI0039BE9F33
MIHFELTDSHSVAVINNAMANVVVNIKPLKDESSYISQQPTRPFSSRPYSQSSSSSQQQELNIAALLPSQNAFATVRIRNKGDKKFFNTVRSVMSISSQTSFALEPNRNETNMTLMEIKELPISMSEKRQQKCNFDDRSTSFNMNRKESTSCMSGFQRKWNDFWSKFDIWRKDMKKIEGNYGRGVVAYFIFIKWLTLLNLFNFIIIFGLIIIPRFYISNPSSDNLTTASDCCNRNHSDTCNNEYSSNITMSNSTNRFIDNLQEFVEGTGWMEYTALFYGYYQRSGEHSLEPIGYIAAILLVLFISLFMIVRDTSLGISYKFDDGDVRFSAYCNLIFGGWDFCIDNFKAAADKRKLIAIEISDRIATEKLLDAQNQRSKTEKNKLFLVRFVLNIIQICFLFCCGWLVYFVYKTSRDKLKEDLKGIENFLYEFLPSITIVCMNLIAPIIFKIFIKFEQYSPNFELTILLVRTVFLRMASLIVFYASMYIKIQTYTPNSGIDESDKDCSKCWESFVGQQIYRLALTDFATHIILTFFVNFPRAYIAKRYKNNNFIHLVCAQTFDLSKHVLDIVYTQMLCWLGSFYAPILPGMFIIIFFAMFYIKKFACMVNSNPGMILYRTSRSKFMAILLLAFIVAVFPVLWTMGEESPSTVCGPFRHYDTIWGAVTDRFFSLHDTKESWIKLIADYLTTIYVGFVFLIILILGIMYYVALKTANTKMTKVLKKQLLLEGRDKKFLIGKLTEILKEQPKMS